MLFTYHRAAQDHQGTVCRRAAYYHLAATPAFQLTRARRADTSVSFPVASCLSSVWQRLKRFLEYLITIAIKKNEKKPKTLYNKKNHRQNWTCWLFIRVFWTHVLHRSLSETGRYGTRQKCLTSRFCEQLQWSHCKKSCYIEYGPPALRWSKNFYNAAIFLLSITAHLWDFYLLKPCLYILVKMHLWWFHQNPVEL